MYTTSHGCTLIFLFDLNFLKIPTDITIQQTQRNNNKPPAEPTVLNKITLFFALGLLFKF